MRDAYRVYITIATASQEPDHVLSSALTGRLIDNQDAVLLNMSTTVVDRSRGRGPGSSRGSPAGSPR